MKIATVETIPVNVPYRRREVSSLVARDGVSDVLVKVTTDEGLVGWGEACCGADTASVEALVGRTVDTFGRLDVAFNNAAGGGHPPTPLGDLPVRNAPVCHAAISLLRCLPRRSRIGNYYCGCAR